MEQPPGYVAQRETKVCRLKKAIYGLKQSQTLRGLRSLVLPFLVLTFADVIQITVFVQRTRSGIIVLVVYVDDILLTDSDSAGIVETKMYPKHHFVTNDIGRPKYFLGIEVVHQKHNVHLSQRKYILDLLEET